ARAQEVNEAELGAPGLEQLRGSIDCTADRFLFQVRVEDDHDFVRPHGRYLLWTTGQPSGCPGLSASETSDPEAEVPSREQDQVVAGEATSRFDEGPIDRDPTPRV